jgi:hypothetical protein
MYPVLIMFLAIYSAVAIKVIDSYWSGHRWARHVVLVISIITLYDLPHSKDSGWASSMLQLGEAGLALYLLFWLNGHEGRAYFGALYRDAVPAASAVTTTDPNPGSI